MRGQERGLWPRTLPVQLIVGFGEACELAMEEGGERRDACEAFRVRAMEALEPLRPRYNGDLERCVPHVLNMAFEGVDQEALIVALKGVVAISNGSACTSSKERRYSHVLKAMNAPEWVLEGAVRMSWCHMTGEPDWGKVVEIVRGLRR